MQIFRQKTSGKSYFSPFCKQINMSMSVSALFLSAEQETLCFLLCDFCDYATFNSPCRAQLLYCFCFFPFPFDILK